MSLAQTPSNAQFDAANSIQNSNSNKELVKVLDQSSPANNITHSHGQSRSNASGGYSVNVPSYYMGQK